MLKITEEELENNENFHCDLEENHDILLCIFCYLERFLLSGRELNSAQKPDTYQLNCLLNFSTVLVQVTMKANVDQFFSPCSSQLKVSH